MDWSIQEVARLAGTTSRTLRHYGEVGMLSPTRIGSNGYRYYDELALVRLQRILMLRDLGLGIPAIVEVLEKGDDVGALANHLNWLRQEKERLGRQIASVEMTIKKREGGEQLVAEEMFKGFDHTQYKDEVEQNWGAAAYADSDNWWRAMSAEQKETWKNAAAELGFDWIVAGDSGIAPDSAEAQALARRQADWVNSIPGTPGAGSGAPVKQYYLWLAETYVDDERFAVNYGGVEGATFVRDAMRAYAGANL